MRSRITSVVAAAVAMLVLAQPLATQTPAPAPAPTAPAAAPAGVPAQPASGLARWAPMLGGLAIGGLLGPFTSRARLAGDLVQHRTCLSGEPPVTVRVLAPQAGGHRVDLGLRPFQRNARLQARHHAKEPGLAAGPLHLRRPG